MTARDTKIGRCKSITHRRGIVNGIVIQFRIAAGRGGVKINFFSDGKIYRPVIPSRIVSSQAYISCSGSIRDVVINVDIVIRRQRQTIVRCPANRVDNIYVASRSDMTVVAHYRHILSIETVAQIYSGHIRGATTDIKIDRINQPGSGLPLIAAGVDGDVIQAGNDVAGGFDKAARATHAAAARQQAGAAYVQSVVVAKGNHATGAVQVRGLNQSADINRGRALDFHQPAIGKDTGLHIDGGVPFTGVNRAVLHKCQRIDMRGGGDQTGDVNLRARREQHSVRVRQIDLAVGVQLTVDGGRVVTQYPVERNRAGVRLLEIDRLLLGNIKARPVNRRPLTGLGDGGNITSSSNLRGAANDYTAFGSSQTKLRAES